MMTKNMETRWYYHGPDDKVYGPYESRDMILWYQSGYFNDALLVRTEHEDRFHTIGEYVRVCGGKLPFHLPIHSMEHIISQLQHPPIRGPINPAHMMLPPGLPPPFPPPTTQQIRFPFVPAMGGPMHPGMTPNGAPYNLSQPPSEPQDGGPSASQTPDSENEFNNAERPRLMNGIHVGIQVPYSQIPKATIGTDPVVFPRSDASTQTMPLIVNSKDAARLLSELLGHVVHVT